MCHSCVWHGFSFKLHVRGGFWKLMWNHCRNFTQNRWMHNFLLFPHWSVIFLPPLLYVTIWPSSWSKSVPICSLPLAEAEGLTLSLLWRVATVQYHYNIDIFNPCYILMLYRYYRILSEFWWHWEYIMWN